MERVFAVLMLLWLMTVFIVPCYFLIGYFFYNDDNKKLEKRFNFTIKLILPDENTNSEYYIGLLHDAGCKDILIGVSENGYISLVLSSTEASLGRVIDSAIRDIKKVIPSAKFISINFDRY